METVQIKKDIAINASRQRVWEVLTQDHYVRQWYASFSEGAYAETDWQEGSKVLFKDPSNNGMVARVVANRPLELLDVEYAGLVSNGQEDTTSEEARAVQGGRETYQLQEKAGHTHLSISTDMTPEYFEMMSTAWDAALAKIKAMAEAPSQN
ncbi:SRPBCC family protein [Rufibacter psychrotolerans]|uniref:SRPBCC family protein n=1 Tax=Rufibacter psychrotolerans TaxID=2812556 RepID=UPI00196874C3|nr:SRPBCC domain-containing protein [Rufibacter sp. SYSU D00308]